LGYCTSCEKHTVDDEHYCSYCGGNLVSNTPQNNLSHGPRTRSSWWYLLPILLGILGGLIAYFVLRKDDPKLAKNLQTSFEDKNLETLTVQLGQTPPHFGQL